MNFFNARGEKEKKSEKIVEYSLSCQQQNKCSFFFLPPMAVFPVCVLNCEKLQVYNF